MTMSNSDGTLESVDSAYEELDAWITENGWAGYDPYDIRGQNWYVKAFGNWCPRKVKTALALVERSLPQHTLRRLLRIKKEINSKGMGLLAHAYLTRFESTGQRDALKKAEDIIAWLSKNACRDHPGISWGYPFHWQSRIFIPRGTPSVVVTGTVGLALLKHYDITGSPATRDLLLDIAEFFLNGLNRPVDDERNLCFSYTPLDEFKVLNASLFAAAFLAQLGKTEENAEFQDAAIRAARYVIDEQNNDGSFFYWGSEPPTYIDHYHTGFVLRHLNTIEEALHPQFITKPLRRGYDYYVNGLFSESGLPKHSPDRLYPLNIHSFAEALLCLSQLGPRLGCFEKVLPVFRFVQNKMRSGEGWYIAERRQTWYGERRDNVPFMRWSQAWMLFALSRLEIAVKASIQSERDASCA